MKPMDLVAPMDSAVPLAPMDLAVPMDSMTPMVAMDSMVPMKPMVLMDLYGHRGPYVPNGLHEANVPYGLSGP